MSSSSPRHKGQRPPTSSSPSIRAFSSSSRDRRGSGALEAVSSLSGQSPEKATSPPVESSKRSHARSASTSSSSTSQIPAQQARSSPVPQPHTTSLPSRTQRTRSTQEPSGGISQSGGSVDTVSVRASHEQATRGLDAAATNLQQAAGTKPTSRNNPSPKPHAPPSFAAPLDFLRRPGGAHGNTSSPPGTSGGLAGSPGMTATSTPAGTVAQQRFGAYGGVAPGGSHSLGSGHGHAHGHVRAGSGGSGHRSSGAAIASALDKEEKEGLRAIRAFLKVRTSYDVLPLSFRLIVLDTALLVKKSLNILLQNGIVSAPLWDSKTSTFAGLLTTSDYINVIQYYWSNPDALAKIDQFRLNSLPDVERAIGVQPVETVSIHPDRPLYEACRKMLVSRARRIPLVDFDDETQRAMVVSVVTQYRILKFVAVNVKETQMLRKPLRDIKLGTYGVPGKDLATATMDTPVMDVIHLLVRKAISSVPILDKDGVVLNVFEGVDVITLIKGGVYDDLQLTVGQALLKRSDDFAGIYTCTIHDRLDTIFDTIRKSRVHRMVVIDEKSKKLIGVLTLSDILEYILLEGEEDEDD